MKKILEIAVILAMLVIVLTGCNKQEITPEIGVNNNENIEKMSKELNEAMYTIQDMQELKLVFDTYIEKIGEQTYLTNFDVSNRLTAISYYVPFEFDNYTVKEMITVEKEGLTNVYVAYKVTGYGTGEDAESGLLEYYLQGMNKYTYQNDKLVNFTKVLHQ